MSEIKLLPCPFCGGEADFLSETATIKCKQCGGAFIVTNPLISRFEVTQAWNTRKPMERIVERLEEMRETFDDEWLRTLSASAYQGRETIDMVKQVIKEEGGIE